MEKRKNPEKDLRSRSGLFFNIGLFSALLITVCAFEFKTADDIEQLDLLSVIEEEEWTPPPTDIPPPQPPKPKLANPIEDEEVIEEDIPEDIVIDIEQFEDIEIPDEPIEDIEEEVAPEIFVIAETMPEPEGGLKSFYQFVKKNLKYPAQARRMGIEGVVYLSFVVNEHGDMVDMSIAKGIGAGCDEEVMRIFTKKSPKWHPGKQRGVPVKVKKMMPIRFTLN